MEHFDIQKSEDVVFFRQGHSSGAAARVLASAVDDGGNEVHVRFNFFPPDALQGNADRFTLQGVDTLNVPLHASSLHSVLELLRSDDPVRIVRGNVGLNGKPGDMAIARRPPRSPGDRLRDEFVESRPVDPTVAQGSIGERPGA